MLWVSQKNVTLEMNIVSKDRPSPRPMSGPRLKPDLILGFLLFRLVFILCFHFCFNDVSLIMLYTASAAASICVYIHIYVCV